MRFTVSPAVLVAGESNGPSFATARVMNRYLVAGALTLAVAGIAHAQPTSPQNIFDLLREYDAALAARDPATVASKYALMETSPWVYFRGNAPQFYRDMANGWLLSPFDSKDAKVWVTGDMHLQNVGVVTLADKSLAFALNDFDEAARASYLMDLQRLAASISLAGDAAKVDAKETAKIVDKAAHAYVKALEDVAKGKLGEHWHWSSGNAKGPIKQVLEAAEELSRSDSR